MVMIKESVSLWSAFAYITGTNYCNPHAVEYQVFRIFHSVKPAVSIVFLTYFCSVSFKVAPACKKTHRYTLTTAT